MLLQLFEPSLTAQLTPLPPSQPLVGRLAWLRRFRLGHVLLDQILSRVRLCCRRGGRRLDGFGLDCGLP